MKSSPNSSLLSWLQLNAVLLLAYLGFFHGCLILGFPLSLGWGLVLAGLTATICVRARTRFINRWEQFFYGAIPVDIALESFIPLHQGYSFYYCAAAFWTVFLAYRVYRMIVGNRDTPLAISPFADSGSLIESAPEPQ